LEDYATEEFVNMLLNEVIGLAPDELNSLEELATAIKENESLMDALKSMVAGKADKTALNGLATEKFVEEAISSIQIPDTTGLATESYVNEAISNIEHPSIDLEPYAKKEDLPSIDGLATETYVQLKIEEALNSIPSAPTYDEIILEGGEI
jgi:hypothetical protein